MIRYAKRNKEDTILLSFERHDDVTFNYTIWNKIPGFIHADEYDEWILPFHQIFMKTIHRLAGLKGLVVGSNIDIMGPNCYPFWFQVIYLGVDDGVSYTKTLGSFMVRSIKHMQLL